MLYDMRNLGAENIRKNCEICFFMLDMYDLIILLSVAQQKKTKFLL